MDLSAAARSDDIADTVDYAAVHAGVVKVIETTSYALLERLASAMLEGIFADHRVARANVTISKPQHSRRRDAVGRTGSRQPELSAAT